MVVSTDVIKRACGALRACVCVLTCLAGPSPARHAGSGETAVLESPQLCMTPLWFADLRARSCTDARHQHPHSIRLKAFSAKLFSLFLSFLSAAAAVRLAVSPCMHAAYPSLVASVHGGQYRRNSKGMRCAVCLRLCIDLSCRPFYGKTCWLWGYGCTCLPDFACTPL